MMGFHARDLRKGRFSEPGRTYLLTMVAAGRRPVFMDFARARLLAGELLLARNEGRCDSLAWVIMPDHLHWLLTLVDDDLSALVARVKARSARHINRLEDRTGTLWQPGYHDHALRREEDLRAVARYVVANPLRAGLVASVADYPFWDACWL